MDLQARSAALDRYQRRHSWLGFPLAVGRKYAEDQGGYLSAILTYYGFFSLFPLLLVAVTLLGFVLPGHPHLQRSVVGSALGQFPVIGHDLRLHGLHGSVVALALGIALALWAGMGVFLALENAMNQVWGVPFRRRPGFLRRRGRALLLLLVLGVGALVTTALSGLGTFGGSHGAAWKVAAVVLSTLLDIGLVWVAFRLLTVKRVNWRAFRTGAVAAGVGWQVLQALGGYYVQHVLAHASNTYGTFAGVIGLLSFIYLSAHVFLLAAEMNAVAHERLWPRSLSLAGERPPTAADRRALAQRAGLQERRPDEQIESEIDS